MRRNKHNAAPPPRLIRQEDDWGMPRDVPNPAWEQWTASQQARGKRERGRRNHSRLPRPVLIAMGALGLAGMTAAAVNGLIPGSHNSQQPAEKAAKRPVAEAPARPGRTSASAQPTRRETASPNGTINLAEAARSTTPPPAAVLTAAKSIVTVEAYGESLVNKKTGNYYLSGGVAGTGVIVSRHGENVVLTDAHVVLGDDSGSKPKPNLTLVDTNVDGHLHEDPITSLQAPRSFNVAGRNYDSGKNIDLAELGVATTVYSDGQTTYKNTDNGYNNLPALNVGPLPKDGDIVYDFSMANSNINGSILTPPTQPDIIEEVVLDNSGGQLTLAPIRNVSHPKQPAVVDAGNSGGPLVNESGEVVANIAAGGQGNTYMLMPASQLPHSLSGKLTGIAEWDREIGIRPDTPLGPQVPFNTATTLSSEHLQVIEHSPVQPAHNPILK